MLTGPGRTIRKAKALRRTMTLPEVLLWRELRKYRGKVKFRRQHPAGRHVLDFFCVEAGLAIEIDGEAHNMGDNPVRDAKRDAWLREQGVRVLRIPARDVLKDLNAAIELILEEARTGKG